MVVLDPFLSLRFQLVTFLLDPLLAVDDLLQALLDLDSFPLLGPLDHLQALLQGLNLTLQPTGTTLVLRDHCIMSFQHLTHLRVVLGLYDSNECLLGVLLLVLVK